MEMKADPTAEHVWLEQLLGEWTYEAPPPPGHDKPEELCRGTEVVRQLGKLWILGEGKGAMPGGGEATMLLTLGFDPAKGRFVGSWIGSMMHLMWVYDGELDASRKKLILNAKGPAMDGRQGEVEYRDVHEFLSPDHRTLTGMMKDAQGEWQVFMTCHYHRVK